MALDDLGTWSVSARLDGDEKFSAVFVQATPEDAVTLMLRLARTNFAVESEQWPEWAFFCVLRRSAEVQTVRTVVFRVSSAGFLIKVADSGTGGSSKPATTA